MHNDGSLSHTKGECKYHVIFIPKYSKNRIYREIRPRLREVLRRLAEQRESRVEEGHGIPDHGFAGGYLSVLDPVVIKHAVVHRVHALEGGVNRVAVLPESCVRSPDTISVHEGCVIIFGFEAAHGIHESG